MDSYDDVSKKRVKYCDGIFSKFLKALSEEVEEKSSSSISLKVKNLYKVCCIRSFQCVQEIIMKCPFNKELAKVIHEHNHRMINILPYIFTNEIVLANETSVPIYVSIMQLLSRCMNIGTLELNPIYNLDFIFLYKIIKCLPFSEVIYIYIYILVRNVFFNLCMHLLISPCGKNYLLKY